MKRIVKLSNFPIASKYTKEIESFHSGEEKVDHFLKNHALIMHQNNMAKTKLFFNENKKFDICMDISKKSGCTFLSVESLENSLHFYESIGFRRMGKNNGLYNVLFKSDELE